MAAWNANLEETDHSDDDADSAVCSEVSVSRAINFSVKPPTQSYSSEDNNEETLHRSVSFCGPYNPESHSHSDDADSAVCSEVSVSRAINFSVKPPAQSCSSEDSNEETFHRSVSFCGPYNPESHRSPPDCDICQQSSKNFKNAIKFCRTCDVNYCKNHLKHHYKVPKLQKHQLEDIMQDGQFVKEKLHYKSTSSEDVECLKSQIEELQRSKLFHMNCNKFLLFVVVSVIFISIRKVK